MNVSRYIPFNYRCLLFGGGDGDGSPSPTSRRSKRTSRDLHARRAAKHWRVIMRHYDARSKTLSTFSSRRVTRRTSDSGALNGLRFFFAPPIGNVWNVISGFAFKMYLKNIYLSASVTLLDGWVSTRLRVVGFDEFGARPGLTSLTLLDLRETDTSNPHWRSTNSCDCAAMAESTKVFQRLFNHQCGSDELLPSNQD